jgi:hypothetical protein
LTLNKEIASMLFNVGNLNNAYKDLLEAFELSKEVYGSENSIDASDILTLMSIIKVRLRQFDEGMNFEVCPYVAWFLSDFFYECD